MATQPSNEAKKVTTNTLQKMKAAGEKISMLTAYDFSFAKIFDAAGIDIILVGDSASNVMALGIKRVNGTSSPSVATRSMSGRGMRAIIRGTMRGRFPPRARFRPALPARLRRPANRRPACCRIESCQNGRRGICAVLL